MPPTMMTNGTTHSMMDSAVSTVMSAGGDGGGECRSQVNPTGRSTRPAAGLHAPGGEWLMPGGRVGDGQSRRWRRGG